MIFKSRQVNLDPEPFRYTGPSGMRRAEHHLPDEGTLYPYWYDPRPEFEPTRDPEPYARDDGWRERAGAAHLQGRGYGWAPRREQFDTPVNRILAEFRQGWSHDPTYGAVNWLEGLGDLEWVVEFIGMATVDEIIHARKVLERLAAFESKEATK